MVNYQIKVKSNVETYLWGSSDIGERPVLETGSGLPMILVVRVDEYGESIILKGTTGAGSVHTFGTLGRDEVYTVSLNTHSLNSLRAVSAKCEQANVDSRVHCTLLSSA